LIEFLAAALDIPKSAVTIRQGATGRRKVVEIRGGPELVARLEALAASRMSNHSARVTPST
jgi:uncharacterized protein YggU (UPF0235/DUF167 family)